VLGVQVGARTGEAAFDASATPVDAAARPRTTARRGKRKETMSGSEDKRVDRRTFVKGGLLAGGLLAGGGAAIAALADADEDSGPLAKSSLLPPPTAPAPEYKRPNILVILVDQMRYPQWFAAQPGGLVFPPHIQRLRSESVSFGHHYTASNDCTPSRSALLTGLHTHQTGCMITGGSTLDPGFPTWGGMLREHGYHTWWYGKWHLTHRDNHWTSRTGGPVLERYGFSGGTFPSPDGGPGQGWRVDPHITSQFEEWMRHEGGSEPWCTTVSLVNPHDIAWWYEWSDRVPAEVRASEVVHRMPPNFETPELLLERNKPQLQRSFQDTTAASFGAVPFTGRRVTEEWVKFFNLYGKLQRAVDEHVGRVLAALAARPEIAANTVVLFTSDHGEYGGSHGLRGKGAAAYEECIRVPLLVKDPRGELTSQIGVVRNQLTSSVDIAPLLLTIATGADDWRSESHYSHLASRLDIARILGEPTAPGREHVLHATDETVTEYAIEPYAADAPLHVTALRTSSAKYATYSNWSEGDVETLTRGQDTELYDYRSHAGRLEIDNIAGRSSLEEPMRAALARATEQELRAPLPERLRGAQERGFTDYFQTAKASALAAAARRKRRKERRERRELPIRRRHDHEHHRP
jgi:arylsulfatase A-like enzyme